MVKTDLDQQERVIQACQNIRIPRHSLSQPVFPFFTPFFISFWLVYNRSRVYQKHGQRSVDPCSRVCRSRSRPFLYFSHQICLLMANLVAHWSNTTKKFLRSIVFAAITGKDAIANQFCNTLAHCAAMQHMGHARKT